MATAAGKTSGRTKRSGEAKHLCDGIYASMYNGYGDSVLAAQRRVTAKRIISDADINF